MRKMTKYEYYTKYPEMLPNAEPGEKYIYLPDDDECPCFGVEYENGEIWVYGARYDRKLNNVDELDFYLNLK